MKKEDILSQLKVLSGKYTVNPEEVTGSVKLVPSVYREEVKKKLAEWAI